VVTRKKLRISVVLLTDVMSLSRSSRFFLSEPVAMSDNSPTEMSLLSDFLSGLEGVK